MTAKRRISKFQPRSQTNNCDNGRQKNTFLGQIEFYGIEGFVPTGNGNGKWLYQWPPLPDFPTFSVSIEDYSIVIAKHGDHTIDFNNIKAADIKARLDDETYEIMRHDANIVEAEIDWAEFEAEMASDGCGDMVRSF